MSPKKLSSIFTNYSYKVISATSNVDIMYGLSSK